MPKNLKIPHRSSFAPSIFIWALPATRKVPHRPPTGAPAGAYIVRAPGAPRRFPARFRGIFRVPPLPGAAPRSGRGGVLASPQHPVQKNSVVSSRRPKHLFYTALTSSRRAATRARSTNFAKASRPRKNLPSLSHNHFGERRGTGSESSGTDTHFFGRQRRRETLQSPVRLREPF